MLAALLPTPIAGLLNGALIIAAVIFWGGLINLLGLLKLILPFRLAQDLLRSLAVRFAQNWAATIRLISRLMHAPQWHIDWRGEFDRNRSYLLVSNHQSWADILILFDILHARVPLPRFFLKRELLWVPIVGAGCWVMDFPFMKRHSREAIAANPALRNEDLQTTRRACEIFKSAPVTVVNFAEGTRFTEAKRVARESPFRHLLRPKSAGLSFTLNAMGEQFAGILDVTFAYRPAGDKSILWSWLCGEQNHLAIHIDLLPIPQDLVHGNYDSDPEFRARFQEWINTLWSRKDKRLDAMLARPPVAAQNPAHS
jgi:1-acyl-sn-glycerol-3-phosphate acyltransferase